MAITIQQDSTIYSLFIYVNCSTCFGPYLHRSLGAHITVSTVSVINETVNAACREHDWMGTHQELISLYLQYLVLMRPLMLPVVSVTGWELC